MSNDFSILKDARDNIKNACIKLNLEDEVYEILKEPKRVLEVSIPLKMDDGSVKNFKGFRVLHNDALGPGNGGIRFHKNITREEMVALSIWMTFKAGVMDIPYGGSQGGISVDPKSLSKGEMERLSRSYIRAIGRYISQHVDILGPDIGTNSQVMAWMADEYINLTGGNDLAIATGKPIEFGGSEGIKDSTGYGVVMIIREVARKLNMNIAGSKIAIQGFGNVGDAVFRYLDKLEAKVVALSVSGDVLYDEEGLKYNELREYKDLHGSFKGYKRAEHISLKDFWGADVDILIPAAVEKVINKEVAKNIKATIVAEGANGPITSEGEKILNSKGVIISPDILTSGGGILVSYFEWLQNIQDYYWTIDKVVEEQRVRTKMAFDNVWKIKEEYNVSLREASYMYSVKTVASVMKIRGWY